MNAARQLLFVSRRWVATRIVQKSTSVLPGATGRSARNGWAPASLCPPPTLGWSGSRLTAIYSRWFSSGPGGGHGDRDWEQKRGGETAPPTVLADEEQGERGEMIEGFEFMSEGSSVESLIALRNLDNVPGLPPLHAILAENPEEEERRERREQERVKQEEITKARVRVVDEQGRAYGTGKRKNSIARVWLEKGDGKVVINGKHHDIYFRDIMARSQVLHPFVQTKTLGEFNVKSTVRGGGISGQAGAMCHGISKALQSFDPEYREALRNAGLLTRDSRVVERKKPGKAKARKSFQWVKR